MHKYARTADRIVDVTNWNKDEKGYYTYNSILFCAPKKYIYKKDIIQEADSIADLCDEIVRVNGSKVEILKYGRNDVYSFSEYAVIYADDVREHGYKYYGAIWTDKGLIYVAELLEYGRLELL